MDPFSLNLIMIVCFVIGSGLIIVEAFIPGFGVAGISGIILEIIALRCCWLRYGTVPTLLALVGVLVLIGLAVFVSYRSAMNGRLSKSHLVLNQTETAVDGFADTYAAAVVERAKAHASGCVSCVALYGHVSHDVGSVLDIRSLSER